MKLLNNEKLIKNIFLNLPRCLNFVKLSQIFSFYYLVKLIFPLFYFRIISELKT